MKILQKKFVIILIITVVVLLIGGWIYFEFNTSIFPPSPVSRVATTDTSKEWKIYRNDIYGFEVQYPSYGFLTGNYYRFAKDINDYVVEIRIPSLFLIEISDGKNLADFSKTAILASKSYSYSSVNNIIVAGVPAIKIIEKDQSNNEYRKVLFVKDGNGYYIDILGPSFEDAEKMLTTFKFTK